MAILERETSTFKSYAETALNFIRVAPVKHVVSLVLGAGGVKLVLDSVEDYTRGEYLPICIKLFFAGVGFVNTALLIDSAGIPGLFTLS